ncbi:hypothetical protein GQ600_23386 [Phytophthora cactorum]|nr:hypothetical protein GQ600_23386 [Phytophthora cactorum]
MGDAACIDTGYCGLHLAQLFLVSISQRRIRGWRALGSPWYLVPSSAWVAVATMLCLPPLTPGTHAHSANMFAQGDICILTTWNAWRRHSCFAAFHIVAHATFRGATAAAHCIY